MNKLLDQSVLAELSKGAESGQMNPLETLGDAVRAATKHSLFLLISSMPRGGLQILQPAGLSDALLKSYSRDAHWDDRATFQAIIRNQPVRGHDCWFDRFKSSRFRREFMAPLNLDVVAAAPVKSPVFEGYDGALHVYRSAADGEFSDAELSALGDVAADLGKALAQVRQHRREQEGMVLGERPHRPSVRQFIFDAARRPQLPNADLSALDERLRQQITQHIDYRLEHLQDELRIVDRLQSPDSDGDLWTFRIVLYRHYPALGEGPFIFLCVQPEEYDWASVRSEDFRGDPELARMIPAVRFMREHYSRSPALGQIARTTRLSPFHFHRRFTELLGLTPKQLLIEFQIAQAKRQLAARQKSISLIARECGFAHQSHFTSRFKKATGLTPTRWQRLVAETAESN